MTVEARRENVRRYMAFARAVDPAFAERQRKLNRTRYWRLKLEVFSHYGGARCFQCGESDLSQLELHHVNGDGLEHRAMCGLHPRGRHSKQPSGDRFYRALKKAGFPSGPPLQVLCRSCHPRLGRRAG